MCWECIFLGLCSVLIFQCGSAPLFGLMGIRPEALAMASGMGSGSMMVAASSKLVVSYPHLEGTIRAYAATSQMLTSFSGHLL